MCPMAKLLFLCGKMAAGKSTLSRQLAERENAVLLVQDEFLERLYPGEIVDIPGFLKYSSRLRDALGPHIRHCCPPASRSSSISQATQEASELGSASYLRPLEPTMSSISSMPQTIWQRQLKERSKGLPAGTAWTTDAEFDAITAFFEPPSIEEHFNIVRQNGSNNSSQLTSLPPRLRRSSRAAARHPRRQLTANVSASAVSPLQQSRGQASPKTTLPALVATPKTQVC